MQMTLKKSQLELAFLSAGKLSFLLPDSLAQSLTRQIN